MRRHLLILFLFISQLTFSQDFAHEYSNFLSKDSIRSDLFTLASDSMEGRETGAAGQKKASFFIESKYHSWGLHPGADSIAEGMNDGNPIKKVYLQDHPISIKNNRERNLCINGEFYLYGKDFFYEGVNSDSSYNINETVLIGMKDKTNAISIKNADRYSGKNIITFDDNRNTNGLVKFFEEKKIKPSIVFIITNQEKPGQKFSQSVASFKHQPFPVFYITESTATVIFPPGDYEKIKSKILSNEKPLIKKIKCDILVDVVHNSGVLRGENVVAFIPGSDLKYETVVISAHYDHLGIKDSMIYYGADDNASGTSAVLELARVFQKAKNDGHGPRRNILFLNVSGEEKGLLGSSWYVAHPAFPLDSTIADLNIDMVGRSDPYHDSIGVKNYIYIIGSDKMSSELHSINEYQNKTGPNLELNYKYNTPDDPNRYYKRSDHYNFVKKGIPVIFYFDGKHNDYHKPTDTADKIDFDQLRNRARLVFLTAWELANRNDRIRVDKKNDLDK